jgi:putative Mn2+ efflux pump MntP
MQNTWQSIQESFLLENMHKLTSHQEKEGKEMALFLELFLMGVGLAMDAFAVSICKGLGMSKVNKKQVAIIGLFFGGFQALMPFIGWLLGSRFEQYITNIDHWVAFVLLAFIGGKMIVEALGAKEEDTVEEYDAPLKIKELFVLAVATSIDALAVGITFAFLKYPIIEAITIIGITTFIISVAGVYVGNFFGSKYKSKAELAGGSILVLLGLRILLTHLGII